MPNIYIFFRGNFFYPVEGIERDEDVFEHVRLNPGTTRVEHIDGRMIWAEERTVN